MASKVILITGVSDYWGARLATRLVTEPDIHVIGLDLEPPEKDIKGMDFIQADVRNPLLADLLRSEEVDTVCHLKFIHSIRPSPAVFDLNVTGARKLLEACAEAGVNKAVLKSSLAVYGAHPNNSAFLTEANALRGSRRYAYTNHLVEIEAFCDDFRHRVPELKLTTLRCASIVGPTADTPMTRMLDNRWAPALLGFDPMFQIMHEDDVGKLLAYTALNDRPGAFNVASEGVMPLKQMMSLAGTLPLPILHPLAYWGGQLLAATSLDLDNYAPIEPDYIRYSWVGDLTKMRDKLGFVPGYTAQEALQEFAARQRFRGDIPAADSLASDEEQLRATIERRRRVKAQQASVEVKGEEDE
jgi:UDP-glucose 4-epimerase